MFLLISMIFGIVFGIAIYNKSSLSKGDCVLSCCIITLIIAIIFVTPIAFAGERLEIETVQTSYSELVPLGTIYPDEYTDNDYVLFKEGNYCFYIKDSEGVVKYKKFSEHLKVYSNKDEPTAYAFEERDFKDDLINTLYPKSLCNDRYYLNIPEGSVVIFVISEGGK